MIKKQTVAFVEVTSIVPEDWYDWFFGAISDNAPFSWGDNNRTLVTAERLHDHCADVFSYLDYGADELEDVNEVDLDNFLRKLEGMGETYIDLEN
jgi:hypothetical protein